MDDRDVLFYVRTRSEREKLPVFRNLPHKKIPADAGDVLAQRYGQYLRREADCSYNCHGLTFVSKLGHFAPTEQRLHRDMNQGTRPEAGDSDSHIRAMLRELDCRLTVAIANRELETLPAKPRVDIGDVILYIDANRSAGKIQHSGLVVGVEGGSAGAMTSITVMSKWGLGGEYVHPYGMVPDSYGHSIEIWTDRSNLLCLRQS